MSAFVVAAVTILLRVVRVQRLLRAASRPIHGRAATDHEIDMRVGAIDRAGRYVPGATCLAKSLALTWMLRGRGRSASVHMGVENTAPLEAHAWVECEGVSLTDPKGAAAFISSRQLETVDGRR